MYMQHLAINRTGTYRKTTLNGRDHYVVPMSMLMPSVLSGSKGALYYPPEEISKNYDAWNGMPLVVNHPMLNGKAISARSPAVINSHGIGTVLNARINKNGKLVAEGWFDVEKANQVDPRIISAIERGEQIELSTGLFTDNIPVKNGENSNHNGKRYTHVARNYRPDHLAILPDELGACSIKDGCGVGVLNSKRKSSLEAAKFIINESWFKICPRKNGRCLSKGSTAGKKALAKAAGKDKPVKEKAPKEKAVKEKPVSAKASKSKTSKSIAGEPTTPPSTKSDHLADTIPKNGKVAAAARVGVKADVVLPPPAVPKLPNLTKSERKVEREFAKAYEKNPDKMAERLTKLIKKSTKPGDPPTFGTDDAKVMHSAWGGKKLTLEQRSVNRATLNNALHATANAVTKKAFIKHLDTLKKGDEVLVTVGGCGAGKGYALKNVPKALEMKKKAKAVWDSAGDQNATENPWIQKELEKRGLKGNYVFVDADPKTQWAHPERGVVKRAQDPNDGRMVDAKVFADSYAHGAKNHQAFYEQNKNNKNANFIFLENGSNPKEIPGIPKKRLRQSAKKLADFSLATIAQDPSIPPHVRRGATAGTRIWPDGLTTNSELIDVMIQNAKTMSQEFDDDEEYGEDLDRINDMTENAEEFEFQVESDHEPMELDDNGVEITEDDEEPTENSNPQGINQYTKGRAKRLNSDELSKALTNSPNPSDKYKFDSRDSIDIRPTLVKPGQLISHGGGYYKAVGPGVKAHGKEGHNLQVETSADPTGKVRPGIIRVGKRIRTGPVVNESSMPKDSWIARKRKCPDCGKKKSECTCDEETTANKVKKKCPDCGMSMDECECEDSSSGEDVTENELSFSEITPPLEKALGVRFPGCYVNEVYKDHVIFRYAGNLYEVGYYVDDETDEVTISSEMPTVVRRVTTYKPVQLSSTIAVTNTEAAKLILNVGKKGRSGRKKGSRNKKRSLAGTDDVSRKARFALEAEGTLDKAIMAAERVARESNRGGGGFNRDDAKLHLAVVARLKEQRPTRNSSDPLAGLSNTTKAQLILNEWTPEARKAAADARKKAGEAVGAAGGAVKAGAKAVGHQVKAGAKRVGGAYKSVFQSLLGKLKEKLGIKSKPVKMAKDKTAKQAADKKKAQSRQQKLKDKLKAHRDSVKKKREEYKAKKAAKKNVRAKVRAVTKQGKENAKAKKAKVYQEKKATAAKARSKATRTAKNDAVKKSVAAKASKSKTTTAAKSKSSLPKKDTRTAGERNKALVSKVKAAHESGNKKLAKALLTGRAKY